MEKEHGFTTREEWARYFDIYFKQITDMECLAPFAAVKDCLAQEWLQKYQNKANQLKMMYDNSSSVFERHVFYFTRDPNHWTEDVAEPLLAYLYRYCTRFEDIEMAQILAESLQVYYSKQHNEIAQMKCSMVFITNLAFLDFSHSKEAILQILDSAIPVFERHFEALSMEEQSIGFSFYDFEHVCLSEHYRRQPLIPIEEVIIRHERSMAKLKSFMEVCDRNDPVNQVLPNMYNAWKSQYVYIPIQQTDVLFHKEQLQYFLSLCQKECREDDNASIIRTIKYQLIELMLNYRLHQISDEKAVKQLLQLEGMLPEYTCFTWDEFDDEAMDVLHMFGASMRLIADRDIDMKYGIERIIERMIQLHSHFPTNNYLEHVSDFSIFEHLVPLLKYLPKGEALRTLIRFTIARQPQTAAHTIMVSRLAGLIMEELICSCPEQFLVYDEFADIADVKKHTLDLLSFVQVGALLHDVGKIVCTNVINMQYRRLIPIEYEAIQHHPIAGAEILEQIPCLRCYRDIALGHHKSYDGKSGYPASFQNIDSPSKIFIDLITICDTLDAACDHLGRSYTDSKAFSTVLQEMKEERGTRYSDVLVDLISQSPRLQERLSRILREEREKSYLDAYDLIRQMSL